MEVVMIYEDAHGLVGAAETYQDAIKLLILNEEIYEDFEIERPNGEFSTIIEDLGADWEKVLLSWNTLKFNEYFDGCYYCWTQEVFKAEN